MKDLISRQAAIEAIDAVFPVDPMQSEYAQGIACGAALAKTYVEQLPSARPEREKGKWIEIAPEEGYNIYKVKCDQCGWYNFFETHYCGNCGADMREAERRKDG